MSVPTTETPVASEETARMTCIWPMAPPAPMTTTRSSWRSSPVRGMCL